MNFFIPEEAKINFLNQLLQRIFFHKFRNINRHTWTEFKVLSILFASFYSNAAVEVATVGTKVSKDPGLFCPLQFLITLHEGALRIYISLMALGQAPGLNYNTYIFHSNIPDCIRLQVVSDKMPLICRFRTHKLPKSYWCII